MRRIYKALVIVAVLAFGVFVAGCGSDDKKDAGVSFKSPTEGATVGSKFTADVDVKDFTIVAADVGKAPQDNKGHLHFSLDNGKYDTPEYSGANGKLAKQLGVDGKYSPAVKPTITYDNIPAGKHTLKVDLANNDHSSTGKSATTTITVKSSGSATSGSAGVSFVTPKDGATTGGTITANVKLSGFKLDAADVGKAPQKGKGHLHFSLDGGKFDTPKYSGANGKLAKQLGVDGKYSPSVMPTITYKGIPAGKHTLKVELANNDHSPAGQEATEEITVG